MTNSDVMSVHDYGWPKRFEDRAQRMLRYRRPVFCTEYGVVNGRSQPRMPWLTKP